MLDASDHTTHSCSTWTLQCLIHRIPRYQFRSLFISDPFFLNLKGRSYSFFLYVQEIVVCFNVSKNFKSSCANASPLFQENRLACISLYQVCLTFCLLFSHAALENLLPLGFLRSNKIVFKCYLLQDRCSIMKDMGVHF